MGAASPRVAARARSFRVLDIPRRFAQMKESRDRGPVFSGAASPKTASVPSFGRKTVWVDARGGCRARRGRRLAGDTP